jgi:hypothetical protein
MHGAGFISNLGMLGNCSRPVTVATNIPSIPSIPLFSALPTLLILNSAH